MNKLKVIGGIITTIISVVGLIASVAKTEDQEKDWNKATKNIEDYMGRSTANRLRKENGEEKAIEIIKQVKKGKYDISEYDMKTTEKERLRRDIKPEEWRDFENGWRPDGWFD